MSAPPTLNWDIALRELDLGATPTPEEARRAYLRLLKTRKPEVDPDGFQRLRAAYELVTSSLVWRRRLQAAEAVVPTTNPSEAGAPSLAPAPLADRPADDAGEPRRTATAREDEPTHEQPPAPERGDPVAPRPASSAAAEGSTLIPVEEITRLLKTGSVAAAAEAIAARYEAGSRSTGVVVPLPYLTLQVLLDLHQRNDLAAAAHLQGAFVRWLETTGAETKVISGGIVAVWIVVRELGALPATFSPHLRAAIAGAARAGDLKGAREAVDGYAITEPRRAEKMAALLRAKTPALAASFASNLDGRAKPAVTRRPGGFSWRFAWFIPAIATVFQLLSGLGSESPRTPRALPDRPVHSVAFSPRYAIPQRAALSLASTAAKAGQWAVEARANEVATSLGLGDCTSARAAMQALLPAARVTDPSDVHNDLVALASSFKVACGAPGGEDAPGSHSSSSQGDTR